MEFADLGILEHIKFYPELFKKAIKGKKERAFVEGIISFSKGLGIKTIATSIETPETLEFAKDIGIDFVHLTSNKNVFV
jgi:EAL domain-containing protein (putative c-di-GMP-specific phosphodiesterase class I)